MNRFWMFIIMTVLSFSVLVGCGSDTGESTNDSAAENNALESTETTENNAASNGEEEITWTMDMLEEDNWIMHRGNHLTMPDGFPSEFPILDNYNLVERIVYEPEYTLGEGFELKFEYEGPSGFLEAVEFYEDFFEGPDFEIERHVVNVEPTDEEGFIE